MDYRKLWFDNNKPNPFNHKYRCVHCGRYFAKKDITIDHIIPQSRLAYLPIKDVLINLQPMCRSCNSAKGNRMRGNNIAGDLMRNTVSTAFKQATGIGVPKKTTKKRK